MRHPMSRNVALLLLATLTPHQTAVAQVQPAPAANADVLAAERLFSAWLEGQIAYRGLPGVVVGVVSDQELIWSAGFGYADVAAGPSPVKLSVPDRSSANVSIAADGDLVASVR